MSDPTTSKPRILVVDDEPSVCQSLRLVLTREGCKVQTAWSGKEALMLLAQEPYDLMVTDFTMSGMKGDELAKLVRERWPATAIIMLTGSADILRDSGTPLPGVDVLINKPFVMDEFRKTIAAVLSGSELSAAT